MVAVPGRGLTASARAVLSYVARHGSGTRPVLAAALDLSKPTVSVAVSDLERAGLVQQTHTAQGVTGRNAAVYGLDPAAGYVLGVDVGNTRVRVRAARLDGTTVLERERGRRTPVRTTVHGMATAASSHVRAVVEQLGEAHGPLRGVAVAVPHTVLRAPASHRRMAEMDSYQAIEPALRSLGLGPEVAVRVENNVNCAALAELHEGCAKGRDCFVVLQVGVRIGLGIVVDGRLMVGANGVAGEAASVPFPWAPGSTPRHEALEEHLGAGALLERVQASWRSDQGPAPADARELFTLAGSKGRGSAAARRAVAAYGEEVGRLATAVAALIDPGLIVLGGGVGSNPLLLEGVRESLDRMPWTTEVVTSALGSQATLAGATRLAVEVALEELLDGALLV